MNRSIPTPSLFATTGYSARELDVSEVPRVQALFDANPEYFMRVNGRRAHADEAQLEFDEDPPAHLGFTRRWFMGFFGPSDELEGIAVVLSDLCAPAVWHIGLFLIATARHGTGDAAQIYAGLESWMANSGARWLRLGVVRGNAAAERFWQRHGYRDVRLRHDVDTGGRINTVRLLVKPMADAGLDEYLDRVPRDRPDSTLP